jgi:hypothetical protein
VKKKNNEREVRRTKSRTRRSTTTAKIEEVDEKLNMGRAR